MNPFIVARDMAARRLTVVSESKGDLTWDGDRGWRAVFGQRDDPPGTTFVALVIQAFRRNPVVSAAVRVVTHAIAEAPIVAVEPTADGDVFLPDHPATHLFVRPNARDSGVCFIERSGQHFFIGGNSFWFKKRLGSGRVDQLLPISPERVISAITDSDGIPLAYRILSGDSGSNRVVDADDIVHIPDCDPLNEVFGLPRLAAAAIETATDNKASEYVSEVLANHGTPGMVITVDAEGVREDDLVRAEERFADRFGPGRGRGKVGFVPGGRDVKEIGFSLQALEFPSLRNVTRESIAAVLGVDPIMIGIGTAARGGTLSGAEFGEARRKLWSMTILPLYMRWEAALNAFLAPEWGDIRLRFDVRGIDALKESRQEAVKRSALMKEVGVFTREEIRAEMGMDPTPPASAVFVRDLQTVEVPVSSSPAGDGDGAGEVNMDGSELDGRGVPALDRVLSRVRDEDFSRRLWSNRNDDSR